MPDMNELDWKEEREWLETVLKEARRQLLENLDFNENVHTQAVQTQKEMWEEVGSVSVTNGLEQIAEFLSYIDMMKMQKVSHRFHERLRQKYEKMVLSPYFGRIDFIEDGEQTAEKYYIGMSNLLNEKYDNLVYDWRAPVSGMFYDYETGEASYNCPVGTISGEITQKRQYKISAGKLEYMFDCNLTIDDEILQEILGKSTDTRMRAIVTTIQREQNKVIRNEAYKNLIVQGPAGSGKTSIALHRVAYLLYKYRETIKPENIVIFSPNDIFNDYISNVLPQLGEENIAQTTFAEFMKNALGSGYKKESYYDMMEYILASKENPAYSKRINNIRFKSSAEFAEILKKYAAYVETAERGFADIIFRGRMIVSEKELKELYFKDYAALPLKNRLEKIKARILFLLKPYEKQRLKEVSGELLDSGNYIDSAEIEAAGKAVVSSEIKEIYAAIDRITAFDLTELYRQLFYKPELFPGSDTEEIRNYTLENLNAGQLYYEDQVPLMYLKGRLGDIQKDSGIRFVIIDEAQDYTPLQYEIFFQHFGHASITMLGDLDQSINPYMNVGVYENIPQIFPKENTCIMSLGKSYRSTVEIMEFTQKILNRTAGEPVERHGETPAIKGFSLEEEIREQILKDIGAYTERGFQSIGIITATGKEAGELYGYLQERAKVQAILNGDDAFTNGAVVIPAYLAKGLEFDVVLIANAGADRYGEAERLLFYTACTRALHVLRVYYCGLCTSLLPNDATSM